VFEPIAQRSGLVGECHGVASEIHQPVAPLAHDVDGVLNVAAHDLTPSVSMWAMNSAAGPIRYTQNVGVETNFFLICPPWSVRSSGWSGCRFRTGRMRCRCWARYR